nr:ribosomal protein S18-alanine N-acetyltransferase [Oleiagrimonas sp. C23AA]
MDDLVELEERTFAADRISRAQYRRHLGSATAKVLVARLAGHLIGSAVLFFRSNSPSARLYSLAIADEARGRGLGRAMLDACERYARQRRCQSIRLEVRVSNRVAIALYERHGYQLIGCREGYYDDGTDALRYEKCLARG